MAYSPESRPPPYRTPAEEEYELRRHSKGFTVVDAVNSYYPPRLISPSESAAAPLYPGARKEEPGPIVKTSFHNATLPAERDALLPSDDNLQVRIVRTAEFDEHLPPSKVGPAELIDPQAPVDRYRFVYIIMLIHGMGVLLAWNVFINGGDYFKKYKFAAYIYNDTETGRNDTCGNERDELCDVNGWYRTSWDKNMPAAAQVPNLLLNAVNLFVNFGGSLAVRIVASIGVLILILAETLGLAIVDTTEWSPTFYMITIISIVIINMASGIYQNSLFGVASSLPQRYINAVIIGNNICGTFISLLNILSISLFPSQARNQAICYFTIALIFLMITFATYLLLPRLTFYRYYSGRKQEVVPGDEQKDGGFVNHVRKLGLVFGQIRIQCWNVFFVFFVTLACFPTLTSNVQTSNSPGPALLGDYFIPVGCFLFFNLFAFVGNLIPFVFVKPGPRWVWIPVLLRVLFIPFFVYCNYRPEKPPRSLSVWFDSDWAYVFGVILLGLTSGYFSSLCMMYAPGQVKDKRLAPVAGQVAAFFLVLGIFVGLQFPRLIDLMI